MKDLTFIWHATLQGYAGWATVMLCLTILERFLPTGKQSLSCRLAGLAFWALWVPASAATLLILHRLWNALEIAPLLSLSPAGAFGIIPAAILSVIAGDFIGYWIHRFQHRWLWRLHAVHHSVEDLNAVNSYHHISETFITTIITLIPTSLIFIDYGPPMVIVSAFTWFQAVFLHSPSRITFGPLRYLIADNRYHRIHHSKEVRHFDRNFAILLPIWDILFGTAHLPHKDEWPETGIAESPQPRTIRQWLDLPLRLRRLKTSDARQQDIAAGQAGPAA